MADVEHARPPLDVRDRLADVVHRAVCEFTQTDGVGACFWYAMAGAAALAEAVGPGYMPQAGGLHLLIDPPDGHFVMDCGDGGFDRGEFHCWIGAGRGEKIDLGGGAQGYAAGELVDFSTRNWKALAETIAVVDGDAIELVDGVFAYKAGVRVPWTIADPPKYLWHVPGEEPYAAYSPNYEAGVRMYQRAMAERGRLYALHRLVKSLL